MLEPGIAATVIPPTTLRRSRQQFRTPTFRKAIQASVSSTLPRTLPIFMLHLPRPCPFTPPSSRTFALSPPWRRLLSSA